MVIGCGWNVHRGVSPGGPHFRVAVRNHYMNILKTGGKSCIAY